MPQFSIGNSCLSQVTSHKHLGLIFTETLSWSKHIKEVVSKCNRLLGVLKQFKYKWPRKALEISYNSFIRPVLEYGNIIYDNCNLTDSNFIEAVQLEGARIVTGAKRCTSHDNMYRELGWQTLSQRRQINKLVKMHAIVNKCAPNYLVNTLNQFKIPHNKATRSQSLNNFQTPRCRTSLYQNSFVISSILMWNHLNPSLRSLPSKSLFKKGALKLYPRQKLAFYHKLPRNVQIWFAQIRMGFSNLQYHLYEKGCVNNYSCLCGAPKEDSKHYFLECPLYTDARRRLMSQISSSCPNVNITLKVLIFGSNALSDEKNNKILSHVCCYICQTSRF